MSAQRFSRYINVTLIFTFPFLKRKYYKMTECLASLKISFPRTLIAVRHRCTKLNVEKFRLIYEQKYIIQNVAQRFAKILLEKLQHSDMTFSTMVKIRFFFTGKGSIQRRNSIVCSTKKLQHRVICIKKKTCIKKKQGYKSRSKFLFFC